MTSIAIVGAGVGGLACARTLQLHGESVTVFERDTSDRARWQGGMLDLHVPTGQAALRAAGLFAGFRALARPEAQEMRGLDAGTGEIRHHELPRDDDHSAPEIDRGQLRTLLLDSLAPGTVHWGHPVVSAEGSRIRFADGTTREFDLVVGADGAWSRVRPAVSAAIPAYSGSTIVETWLEDVDRRHPALAALVGPGTVAAVAGEEMISAQRNSDGHVRVYAGVRVPADWRPADPRAYLLDRFAGWHDRVLDLIRRSDGDFTIRPIHVLPTDHAWDHVPGVTLVGDAAHLMPPYGIGANLALVDGTDLATAINEHTDLDEAVRAYEAVMLPRAKAAAETCAEVEASMLADSTVDVDAVRTLLNERMAAAGG